MPRVTVTDDRPEDPPETVTDPLENSASGDLPEGDAAPEAPIVAPDDVADALREIGGLIHGWAGHPDVPDHWAFTDSEIGALAPPVTSLINRHAAARRLAARSPELAVGLVLGRWGLRNARLSSRIREAIADLETADEPDDDDGEPVDLSPLDDGVTG